MVTALVTKKRSASTVMNIWVTALKAVGSWAVKQRLIARNPFVDCSVPVPKKTRRRETQAFMHRRDTADPERRQRNQGHNEARNGRASLGAWICAYSGARAGEITRLRGQDVIERDGINALRITPDAGSIKTREARTVPLREHQIAQGFLEFVNSKGKGPLFYYAEQEAPARDITNPKLSPAIRVHSRLGEWVRSIGVADKEASPTQGWRHTFKQIRPAWHFRPRVGCDLGPRTRNRGVELTERRRWKT